VVSIRLIRAGWSGAQPPLTVHSRRSQRLEILEVLSISVRIDLLDGVSIALWRHLLQTYNANFNVVVLGSAAENGRANQLSLASAVAGCPWRLHMSPDDAVWEDYDSRETSHSAM
jgi:hypothetical protein